MSDDSAILRQTSDGKRLFWCPGCKCGHALDARWFISGPPDRPTANPSVLHIGGDDMPRCHLYIREGKLVFLADCTHVLAGTTVDMEPLYKTPF